MKRLPSRSGSMLIQQLILVSIASSLLLTLVATLHRGLTFSSNFRADEALSLSLRRLAPQFREDIHTTRQVMDSSASKLELKRFDQAIVRYEVTSGAILRELIPDTTDEMKTTDRFYIPKQGIVSIATDGQRCSIQVSGPTDSVSGEAARTRLLVQGQLLLSENSTPEDDQPEDDQPEDDPKGAENE